MLKRITCKYERFTFTLHCKTIVAQANNMPNPQELSTITYSTPLHKQFLLLNSFQQAQFKSFVSDTRKKRSNSTINNWFRGDNEPSFSEKKLIAEYFEVNQSELFPEKSKP